MSSRAAPREALTPSAFEALASRLYLTARLPDLGKEASQKLEAELHEWIVHTEELIHQSKRDSEGAGGATHRHYRGVFKRVADGLAWRFFGFDEHLLRVYAGEPPPGFIAGKSGSAAERSVVDAAFGMRDIRFAIQNDITNVLRVADVTVLRDDGIVLPIEVKTSQRGAHGARAAKQRQRFEAIQRHLREDTPRVAKTGEPVHTLTVEVPRRVYWTSFEDAAKGALKNGTSSRVCDRGVMIVCYRTELQTELERLLLSALSDAGWKGARVRFGALSRQLDPQDHDIVRYVVPLTAFDVDPAVVLALLLGRIDALVLLDINVVREMLEARGFQFRLSSDGCAEVSRSTGAVMRILERPWNRVVYGLLSLESFVDEVSDAYTQSVRAFAEIPRIVVKV